MKVPKRPTQPMKVPGTPQPVPPVYLQLAAAHMDTLGKLGPQQPTNPPASDGS